MGKLSPLLFLIVWFTGLNLEFSAASAQSSIELVKLGRGAYFDGQDRLALSRWLEADKQGDVDATFYVGWLYSAGRGVDYDPIQAMAYFHRAASKGHALAAIELAALLEEKPIDRGMGDAEDWYKLATDNLQKIISQAQAGDPFAQSNLGFMYGFGKGVEQDLVNYAFWQKAAAEAGLASGQYHLAYCLETGTGVEKSPKLALKWMKKAAIQGLVHAQEQLGQMFLYGIGTEPELKEAERWFRLAADSRYYIAEKSLASLYLQLGRFNEALPFIERAYARIVEVYGPTHSEAANARYVHAQLLLNNGDSRRAAEHLLEAISVYESLFGKGALELTGPLTVLAQAYHKNGDVLEVKKALDRAIEIVREHHGEDHADYAAMLEHLGSYHSGQGEFREARDSYQQAMTIYKSNEREDRMPVARTALNLAWLTETIGDLAEAKALYETAVDTYREVAGEKDLNYAIALHRFAGFFKNRLQYLRAKELYNQAERIAAQNPGISVGLHADILSDRSTIYTALGEPDAAERDITRAVHLAEKQFGRGDARTLKYLISLSDLYEKELRLDDAERLLNRVYKQSIADREGKMQALSVIAQLAQISLAKGDQNGVRKHFDTLESLTEQLEIHSPFFIGNLYYALSSLSLIIGEPSRALDFIQKSVAKLERHFDKGDPRLAKYLLAWAHILSENGNNRAAADIGTRAFRTFERHLSNINAKIVFEMIKALDFLNASQDKKDQFFEKWDTILVEAFGRENSKYAEFLRRRAGHIAGIGDDEERRRLGFYRQALDILESIHGKDHPVLLDTLEELASELSGQGILDQVKRDEAQRVLERIVDISKAAYGENSSQHASAISSLANEYTRRSFDTDDEQLRRAEIVEELALQRKRLKIIESIYGKDDMETSRVLSAITSLHEREKNYTEALRISRRNFNIMKAHIGSDGPPERDQTEIGGGRIGTKFVAENSDARSWSERNVFEDHVEISLNRSLPGQTLVREKDAFIALQYARTSRAASAISKLAARVAAEDSRMGKAARELQDAFKKRGALGNLLAMEYSKAEDRRNGGALESYRSQIEETNQQIISLRDHISKNFPRYDELIRQSPATVDDVQTLLGEHEALVTTFSTIGDVFVFAVRKNRMIVRKSPISYKLGARSIKKNISIIRDGIDFTRFKGTSDLLKFDIDAAHQLYKQTLGLVDDALEDVDHLIFVPGKAMQLIPIALLVREGEYPQPERLIDFRTVPWLYRKFAISTLPSIASLKTLRTITKPSKASRPFIGFGAPNFSAVPDGTVKPGSNLPTGVSARRAVFDNLPSLPETADELRQMADFLGAERDSIVLGSSATEAELSRRNMKDYRVVAFATHGVMAGEEFGLDEPALFLTPGSGADNDGVLTAGEISQLNLDAEFVILSACNTAAGEDERNEGLSGLARAFLYAGSRALLVSHWPVESTSATKLTVGIFQHLQSTPNIGQAEALRRSVHDLAANDDSPAFSHPAYWAPFSLVGDGRAKVAR